MENLKNTIKEKENSLEQLISKIPGFKGYRDREQSRTADKLQRKFLSDKLNQIKSNFMETSKVLIESGQLEQLTKVDSYLKKFDYFIDKINYAEYGYSGLFDAAKVNIEELEKVYEYDLTLVALLEKIETLVTAWNAEDPEKTKQFISEIKMAFDEFDKFFEQRKQILKGGN